MRPYRIGLVVGNKSSDYPFAVRMGIQNTIEAAGHLLVTITDLVPHHDVSHGMAYYRLSFQIASRLDLDAIIVPVGSVMANIASGEREALGLLKSLDPARTIVMERDVAGFRCVTKDNAPGMRDCMRHLIETCGFRRIAFVSGPSSSQGAREREGIYFEEMAAHGLETPSRLFARGNFRGECADVIEKILDDNPDLEAIACAADLIAYTAYDVIRKRDMTVGEDIAVTGFDDHVRSAHLDPPLSTVHMTGYDFGRAAAREAIRLCEGLPQRERVLRSSFVSRGSCGENMRGDVERFRELVCEGSIPLDKIASVMVDATLFMAGPRIERDFHARMRAFVDKVVQTFQLHLEHPDEEAMLFSSSDLANLLLLDYRDHISLEGFHASVIELLEALLEESPEEDAAWVFEQTSYLHLRVARLLNNATQSGELTMQQRAWTTFHIVDDVLRVDSDPVLAHRLMLEELMRLGVREADLFLLAEPVEFMGVSGPALSDMLLPIGTLSKGFVCVDEDVRSVPLQEVLGTIQQRYGESTTVCTVGPLVAGNELLGIGVIDAGTLNQNGIFMAFLNLGFALKHLQTIADEREMNSLLNASNLLLERQSQHDELTGLLNRRGFLNRIEHVLKTNEGTRGAVLYLDLDGLKDINDTLGHDVGDQAICHTARILEGCLPKGGLLARLGGDEFVMFVLLGAESELEGLSASIHRGMELFNRLGTMRYELSISFGADCFCIDGDTASRLAEHMSRADERLYRMKRSHRRSRRYVQGDEKGESR